MLRRASLALTVAVLSAVASCADPPPPISVGEGTVTVLNQTEQDWKEVLIVVNDHFRGYLPVLKAEGRANAPLNQFTTGHGQRWTAGSSVRTIDVTAKSGDNTEVKLTWGRDEEGKATR